MIFGNLALIGVSLGVVGLLIIYAVVVLTRALGAGKHRK